MEDRSIHSESSDQCSLVVNYKVANKEEELEIKEQSVKYSIIKYETE